MIPECTQEEYESALALVRQLGLDLDAVNINWTALEPMRHSRSSGTKHWSSWPRTAVLTMGSLSDTATIPDTVEKIVEEWGSQAPYVLSWKGDSGRLALTYIISAALSNMVGDTGALTNSGCVQLTDLLLQLCVVCGNFVRSVCGAVGGGLGVPAAAL